MKLSDYTKFANENPVCYVATVDEDQPRVRGFLMWFADDTGFYFHTGATKAVAKQLVKNPKIEVCFYSPAPMEQGGGTMMRVSGKVEFVDDKALKARLLDERPFLKEIQSKLSDDSLVAIFRIYTGEAHFWTMTDNLKESQSERVRF